MHVSGAGQNFVGCDPNSVIDAADRLEIEQLVCSIPIIGGKWATPAAVRACNDAMLAATRRFRDRILGYCRLNAVYGREALQERAGCVWREGMTGIKLFKHDRMNGRAVVPVTERTIVVDGTILSRAG